MPNNISAYLSSADTTINLGTDSVLLLSNPVTTPIICDFTSVIRISKEDLKGISYQLNPDTFAGGTNYVDANEDDITITIDQETQSKNIFSKFLSYGDLRFDANSPVSTRISSIQNYIDYSPYQIILQEIVGYVYGDARYISFFKNENEAITSIKSSIITGVRDQNSANIASTSYINNCTNVPIPFKWKRGQNKMIDDAINIFTNIATIDSPRLNRFNSFNNYRLYLSDLLQPDDTLSFVVTYTQNQNQKTFSGADPPTRIPSKMCVTIIVTE